MYRLPVWRIRYHDQEPSSEYLPLLASANAPILPGSSPAFHTDRTVPPQRQSSASRQTVVYLGRSVSQAVMHLRSGNCLFDWPVHRDALYLVHAGAQEQTAKISDLSTEWRIPLYNGPNGPLSVGSNASPSMPDSYGPNNLSSTS